MNNKVQVHPWWQVAEDIEGYASLKDAQKILHYSRSTLIRKIYKRQIKGFKIFGRWYVRVTGI